MCKPPKKEACPWIRGLGCENGKGIDSHRLVGKGVGKVGGCKGVAKPKWGNVEMGWKRIIKMGKRGGESGREKDGG